MIIRNLIELLYTRADLATLNAGNEIMMQSIACRQTSFELAVEAARLYEGKTGDQSGFQPSRDAMDILAQVRYSQAIVYGNAAEELKALSAEMYGHNSVVETNCRFLGNESKVRIS